MERTFALSLTPIHSSPNLTEWNANALTQWHPTLTNRLEGTLTHEPPILTNRGMEGTLTHSLTDLPLEGVGGQIGDHTHSNSLSHTDSRARALSHSLTYSLTSGFHTEGVEGTRGSGRSEWRSHSLQLPFTHRLRGTLTLSFNHSLTHSLPQSLTSIFSPPHSFSHTYSHSPTLSLSHTH